MHSALDLAHGRLYLARTWGSSALRQTRQDENIAKLERNERRICNQYDTIALDDQQQLGCARVRLVFNLRAQLQEIEKPDGLPRRNSPAANIQIALCGRAVR